MNIILAAEEEIDGDRIVLTGERADHIVKVLRSQVGDTIRFGVLDGAMGKGVIHSIKATHPRAVIVHVKLDQPLRPVPRLDLVVAMSRPIMMRRILSQATALGIGTFHIIHANRVEKSFWGATVLDQENYREHLVIGLEQAVDTRLPEVLFHRRFKPFIEDYIPGIVGGYSHLLLAHPGGASTLDEALVGERGRILMAVGPEGGWIDYEVEMFRSAGFAVCPMGERILKVDTAVVALHSRISQLCGE